MEFTVLVHSCYRTHIASVHKAGCRDIKREKQDNASYTYNVEGSLQEAIDSYVDEELLEMGYDADCIKIHNCAKKA